MVTLQEETVDRVRHFFQTRFKAPSSADQVSEDLSRVLESPIFKQHIFANNSVSIMDHSSLRYIYISPHSEALLGVNYEVLVERGMAATMEIVVPDDIQALSWVWQKATELVMTVTSELRYHFRLHYSCRIRTPRGIVRMFQQCIPLALNEEGYPYIQLGIVSDISEFRVGQGISYKMFMNEPGKPIEILAAGTSENAPSPFTDREKEIVYHMADGLDANAIADKLFLSEGTVRTHRKNVLKKTGAKNSVHLVRMAVANGWV